MRGHALALADPSEARRVSDMMRAGVTAKTEDGYSTGWRSFTSYLEERGLPLSMPVDPVSVVFWLRSLCPRVKPKSLRKYLSGVRWAHIMQGFECDLSSNPTVKIALRSLAAEYPELAKPELKIPMSVALLQTICGTLKGWPNLGKLDYDDLLWVAVSCVGLFGAMRGGELFTSPESTRPILEGRMVGIKFSQEASPLGPRRAQVHISVPLPKTRSGVAYQLAVVASPLVKIDVDPVRALEAYRRKAMALGLDTSGGNPAFQLRDGKPVTRDFMVKRAHMLLRRTGVELVDEQGAPIKFKATSWRAGYVESATQAGVSELQVRATGRWASRIGMMSYSSRSEHTFQSAADAIGMAAMQRGPLPTASVVVGKSSSGISSAVTPSGGSRIGTVRYLK